ELQAARVIHEMGEARFAVMADGHHSPGHADGPEGPQLLVGGALQPLDQRARPVGDGEATAEGVEATRGQGGQVLVALADDASRLVGRELRSAHASALRSAARMREALMKGSRSPSMTPSSL